MSKNVRDKKMLLKFGQNLRTLRQKAELSMRELGNEAGIEHSQIYKIEKGLADPSLSTLTVIAKALKITVSELTDYK